MLVCSGSKVDELGSLADGSLSDLGHGDGGTCVALKFG